MNDLMPIPMSSPDLTEVELAAVARVLQTNHLSIGPQIDGFEQGLARYVGMSCAIGVNSGTSGLHLAIIAAGVSRQTAQARSTSTTATGRTKTAAMKRRVGPDIVAGHGSLLTLRWSEADSNCRSHLRARVSLRRTGRK